MDGKLGRAKFQPFAPGGTLSNWGRMKAGRKNVHFQQQTGHVSETVIDRA